jgi:hypothetical protein
MGAAAYILNETDVPGVLRVQRHSDMEIGVPSAGNTT